MGLGVALAAVLVVSACSSDEAPAVETGAVGQQTVIERVEAPAVSYTHLTLPTTPYV